jgi:hypothetical protein
MDPRASPAGYDVCRWKDLPGPWSGGSPWSWSGMVADYLRASRVFMISSHSDIWT